MAEGVVSERLDEIGNIVVTNCHWSGAIVIVHATQKHVIGTSTTQSISAESSSYGAKGVRLSCVVPEAKSKIACARIKVETPSRLVLVGSVTEEAGVSGSIAKQSSAASASVKSWSCVTCKK